MDLNNRRTGEHATKPRTLGLFGHSVKGHGILLYNFHKYCMIYRLPMFEKLKNIMRDTVCRGFLHHIVLSYYIWDNVCRTFMRHIVVSYYIKATDVKKKMATRFVVNYYILPIDVNAVATYLLP